MRADLGFRGALARRIGFGHDSTQHVDEQARQRQIRPGRVGGDVEQHDEAFAAPLGGDERGAVGEARPGLLGQSGLRLGEHLARNGDFVRRGEAEEWAARLERRDMLGRFPGQRAAEQASAAAKRGRSQRVVAGGEPGAGEAQQHAAAVEKLR